MDKQVNEKPQDTDKKKLMSEEKMIALKHAEQQLNDLFENMSPGSGYTDGWPEDRWEEEMDKHPFFMKSNPENGQMSPLVEGLALLRYDPDENEPAELATNYREDGNFNFKHKNYRLAILGYTEGIKVKCDSAEINASLYNNRAAAHWFLKNYRSALSDSEKALTFNENHKKARLRAAKAALEVAKYDTCIQHCQKLLEDDSENKEILEILNAAKKKKLIQERDQRKKDRLGSKKSEEKDLVIKAIIERKIRISKCEDEDDIDLGKLEPTLPGAQDAMVHIEKGVLKWPVLLLYPEYQMTDFIKACPENVPLLNQLEQVFPAPWDEHGKYSCGKVNVYFEGYDKMPHLVDPSKKLGDLLVMKYFELKAGTPAFYILPRGTVLERKFLESYL